MTHLIPSREDMWFPLQKEFDRMFNTMFGHKRLPSLLNSLKTHSGYPKLDVLYTDGRFRIEAAVPGVQPEDLRVEIVPGEDAQRCVKISGKIARDYASSSDTEYHFKELTRAKFSRLVGLPDEVQGDPEAELSNGLLTLTWKLPEKAAKEEIKNIPVKVCN